MRNGLVQLSTVALGVLTLAACGDDTPTQPELPAQPTATAPELAVASNSWITRANMPANRTRLAAATVTNAAGQSIVYAIGGLNASGVAVNIVTAYNVATNTWTFRHTLPVPLAESNGAGVVNGKIYVSGGYSDRMRSFPGPTLYAYDPATNTWTQKRSIPVVTDSFGEDKFAAGHGVTGVINGKLYVLSGCFQAQDPWGYFQTCDALFFRYDPATDRWVRLPDPPFEPMAIGGVIAGKFYVVGAVYDPVTNKWTLRNALGLPRLGAASAVLGGKLYVMGGQRYNAERDAYDTLDKIIVYDPTTNLWTTRASMPSPRFDISGSTVKLNGQARIEVVGGNAPGNNIQYIP